MRVSLVFATLLCFTTWKSCVQPHMPVARCCVTWSKTKVRLIQIATYTLQSKDVCSIAAIMFHTTRGKIICSDPKSLWARRAKDKVDKESREKALQVQGQTEKGATNIAIPTAVVTPEEDRKNTLQKNRQNDEGATRDITPATTTTSTYTTQRANGQNDEGATSDITPATATTSKLHLTEKPKVQRENGAKTFCLRSHNSSHSYHRQQTLLFPIALVLLYCINSKHM